MLSHSINHARIILQLPLGLEIGVDYLFRLYAIQPASIVQASMALSSRDVFVKFIRPATAEFVATCFFVFIVVCTVTTKTVLTPLVVGLVITASVIVFMDVSGAHVNPAVTLAVFLNGGINFRLSLLYVFSQLSGSLVGAGFAKAVVRDEMWQSVSGGCTFLGEGISVGTGIFAEILTTANLVMFVLLSALDNKTKSNLASLAIGLAVATGIFATDPLTGGSMNPARSFGPAVVGPASCWKHHYVYWIGPIIGSLLGSFLYSFLLASPENIVFFRRNDGGNNEKNEGEADIPMIVQEASK